MPPKPTDSLRKDSALFHSKWRCAVELDSQRTVTAGSNAALVDAIRRGADLQVQTAFLHCEHIDTSSDSDELIREVAEFRMTCLLEARAEAIIATRSTPAGTRWFTTGPTPISLIPTMASGTATCTATAEFPCR